MHIRSIPFSQVPEFGYTVGKGKEGAFETWLGNIYKGKDEMMDGFYKEGRFPDDGKKVEIVRIVPRWIDVLSIFATVVTAWQIVSV
ncbi:hypothetical protein HDU67_005065, partial [Dinochytrium kinnereticum]